jgi:hypothetical protein
MGASIQAAKKMKIKGDQLKPLNEFLPMKIKGQNNLVYVDMKRKKIIPILKPLNENSLYAKRKFNANDIFL